MSWRRRSARVGGVTALAVSTFLLARLIVIDRVNPLAMATVVIGAVAGLLAIFRPTPAGALVAGCLLGLGALPALVGWAGWLYLPSIALEFLAASAGQGRTRTAPP